MTCDKCGAPMQRVAVIDIEAELVDRELESGETEAGVEVQATGSRELWRCERCGNEKPVD